MKHPSVFGYLAEFETPSELVQAAEKVYADGYRKIDTYSPFPIESAAEAGWADPQMDVYNELDPRRRP